MEREKQEQIHYLRKLAEELVRLAETQENARKRQRWADLNDLRKREEPLLWVCPDDDGGWLELLAEEPVCCSDPDYRELEIKLQRYLYHGTHFSDDFVFEKNVYFQIPGEYTGYLYGNAKQTTAWGVDMVKPHIGTSAYHLDNFLKTEEDYQKLLDHQVDFIPDRAEWQRLKEKYQEVLEGILEVEFHLPYSVLVQSHLIELVHLRGLQELLYDVYDDPELLTDVLSHMGNSKAQLLKRLEENKLLFDNRTNIYTGSGSLGYTNDKRKAPEDVKLTDMWGFADAQEFSNVSPAMFEEFAIKNQKIGLNLFGRGCYGCCEPMDEKYEAVFSHIHNIRRISISPWADIREAAEKIGKRAIYSYKPDPTGICTGFEEAVWEKKLLELKEVTKDCYLEIILKDIRTCGNTNAHLIKFIDLCHKVFS